MELILLTADRSSRWPFLHDCPDFDTNRSAVSLKSFPLSGRKTGLSHSMVTESKKYVFHLEAYFIMNKMTDKINFAIGAKQFWPTNISLKSSE